MHFDLETHDDTFVITPAFILQVARCEDPACEENHGCIRISWFIWTFTAYLP